ncbi:MAG: DNA polymerase III subunit delta [Muribaculaceae bacterium]|nr:DNA polymerase III subunit delta [Muribaculaceae bacterium]
MQFRDIIGHKDTIDTLRNIVDNDCIPHAILLSGISGIGKMNVARAFIQYINCQNRHDGDSCGICPSCRRIEQFSEPDIHYSYPIYKKQSAKPALSEDFFDSWCRMLNEYPYMPEPEWQRLIEAGNKQLSIYVDESDHLSELASLSSYSAKYKIFVIWQPEKLNLSAANKLLKLIEEPYNETIFVAVSNNPDAILPTILSRMRRIELKRPDDTTVINALVDYGEEPQRAKEIAGIAAGNLQKAFDLASLKDETVEFGETFRNVMRMAYACKVSNLRTLADRFNDMGRDKAIRLLTYFADMIRENFIANLRMPILNNMNKDEEAFSQKFAPFIHENNVEGLLTEVDNASRDIARNANAKLVWFDFLLRLMSLLRKPRENK